MVSSGITAVVNQTPSTCDDFRAFAFAVGNLIFVGGFDFGRAVVGHVGSIAGYGNGSVKAAVFVGVDGDIFRSGEGGFDGIENRDSLDLVSSGITAVVNQTPSTCDDFRAFAFAVGNLIFVGGFDFGRAVVGLIGYIASLANGSVKAAVFVGVDGDVAGSGEGGLDGVLDGDGLGLVFSSVAAVVNQTPGTCDDFRAFAVAVFNHVFIRCFDFGGAVVCFVGHIASLAYFSVIVAVFVSVDGDVFRSGEGGLDGVAHRDGLNGVAERNIAANVNHFPDTVEVECVTAVCNRFFIAVAYREVGCCRAVVGKFCRYGVGNICVGAVIAGFIHVNG